MTATARAKTALPWRSLPAHQLDHWSLGTHSELCRLDSPDKPHALRGFLLPASAADVSAAWCAHRARPATAAAPAVFRCSLALRTRLLPAAAVCGERRSQPSRRPATTSRGPRLSPADGTAFRKWPSASRVWSASRSHVASPAASRRSTSGTSWHHSFRQWYRVAFPCPSPTSDVCRCSPRGRVIGDDHHAAGGRHQESRRRP